MLQKLKLKVVIMLTESCSNGDYISNGYKGETAPGLQVTFWLSHHLYLGNG